MNRRQTVAAEIEVGVAGWGWGGVVEFTP